MPDVGGAREHDDGAVEIELDLDGGVRLAGPVHGLGRAADVVRAGKAQTFAYAALAYAALALRQLAPARTPAARLLDPVHALRQAVAVHHQVVVGERRRGQIVRAPHRQRIKSELARHLVEQALEGEADVDGAVAAERAARRRVGEHALADIFDVVQVVDGVEHRAGIENRHDAVAGMRAAALVTFALDGGDLAVLAHAELEADVGLRPAAMGDEGLLAVDHHAHAAAGPAREQGGDQLDVERFRAAAEAAADVRLDHADARHVHVEDLRQHQMHVIGHLRAGVDGHALALGVVARERGVHLHLVLADLGLHAAELEQHIALDVVRPLRVDVAGALRHRRLRGVVRGQFAHLELDEAERALGGGVVDGGDRRDRLAAIAHLVARQRVLAARDRQDAEGLVAIGAGDDGLHARQPQRRGDVDVDNLGVRIRAAEDASRQQARCDQVGGVFRPSRHLVGPVDHRHVAADIVRRHDLVHGETPPACSSAAYFTASMILT